MIFNSMAAHTPPGTSDEHLTVVKTLVNARPEGAVIVTTPQEVALATIRKEINFCRKMKLKVIGLVENMSGYQCPCCSVSHKCPDMILLHWDFYRVSIEYGGFAFQKVLIEGLHCALPFRMLTLAF